MTGYRLMIVFELGEFRARGTVEYCRVDHAGGVGSTDATVRMMTARILLSPLCTFSLRSEKRWSVQIGESSYSIGQHFVDECTAVLGRAVSTGRSGAAGAGSEGFLPPPPQTERNFVEMRRV
ncbi:hypothetical protein PENTCL1PPCAC_24576 [Pristionchus entomophagus]|uniref:Uncharacterized protein n=1 Tax=Pristionchus entomophagus TaxID=358040 RepID=A0AAV5U782_9BILA|nr:hypothetical protein PENTCL1PPCAC_24576 [Pristionchus entomophagus]